MGYSVGYDDNWKRDIGYGVPAICDHPDCDKAIDRGLGYVCAEQEPYGGGNGCGLFFCGKHSNYLGQCERCENGQDPFEPSPDTEEWVKHKMTHPSWEQWRKSLKP